MSASPVPARSLAAPRRRRPWPALLALGVALAMGADAAVASKLYKWVDEEGRVHYSQRPPPEGAAEADKIETRGAAAGTSLSAELKGEYEYCGGMRLPGPVYQERKVMARLLRQVDEWDEQLRLKDQELRGLYAKVAYGESRSRRDSGYVQARVAKLRGEIEELRCAQRWAERKRGSMSDYRREVEEDLGRLRFNHAELSRRAESECGPAPVAEDVVDRFPAWDKCMGRYRSRIQRTKRDMDRLEVQLKQFR